MKRNSKRLPNKNVLDFNGKPCFLWNVEKCKELFDKVYVSSENLDILIMAKQAGAIPIVRGEELTGDVPDIPVFKHAMEQMEADAFVAVHANNPTVEPSVIERVKLNLQTGAEEVMTCHPMTHGKEYKEQYNKIYGSVRGMTRRRLNSYRDAYRPEPDVLIVDDSIEIETQETWDQALQSS